LREKFRNNYSYIFEKELLQEIESLAVYKEFKENDIIIDVDHYIVSIPLVLDGAIKILRQDEGGNEMILYFIERGDTCAMTLSCCMGQSKSKIRAVAETDVSMLMIPKQKMKEWLTKYGTWQEYILQSYHGRMHEFIEALDTIAFLNMDMRLLKYLRDKAMVIGNDEIYTTHKEIAEDLHTSRVVISRLLKGLEKEGKIKLNRNNIRVIDL